MKINKIPIKDLERESKPRSKYDWDQIFEMLDKVPDGKSLKISGLEDPRVFTNTFRSYMSIKKLSKKYTSIYRDPYIYISRRKSYEN